VWSALTLHTTFARAELRHQKLKRSEGHMLAQLVWLLLCWRINSFYNLAKLSSFSPSSGSMDPGTGTQDEVLLAGLTQEDLAQIGAIIVRAINRSSIVQITRVHAQRTPSAYIAALGPRLAASAAGTQPSAVASRAAATTSSASTSSAPSGTPALLSKGTAAQSLLDEHRKRMEGISTKGKSSNKTIKFKQNQIIYVPERLLNQKLDINKAVFLALLSRRGCRLTAPKIPCSPGTLASIKSSITDAFKTNSPPTDLSIHGFQFAQLLSGNLVPVTVQDKELDADRLQGIYSDSLCVIVPAKDVIDPDFHKYRVAKKEDPEDISDAEEEVEDVKPRYKGKIKEQEEIEDFKPTFKGKGKEKETAIVIDDSHSDASAGKELPDISHRPRARPVLPRQMTIPTRPAVTSQPSTPAEPLSPHSPLPRDPQPQHCFCFYCAAPLGPEDEDAGDIRDWHDAVVQAHEEICPRKGKRSIQFAPDSDDPDGPPQPAIMQMMSMDDLEGMNEGVMPRLIERARKHWQQFGGELPTWAQEKSGACEACNGPDDMDNMVMCDACPRERWVSCSRRAFPGGQEPLPCPHM